MKNRAKCLKCNEIIESFHASDYVSCECGMISLDEGEAMKCFAKDWDYFVRVDDEGNIVKPKIIEKGDDKKVPEVDMIQTLKDLIETIEGLPVQAKNEPLTQHDFLKIMIICVKILERIEGG